MDLQRTYPKLPQFRIIPDNYTAWHAGKSRWGKLSSLNKDQDSLDNEIEILEADQTTATVTIDALSLSINERKQEIEKIQKLGVKITNKNLYIAENAILILPLHKELVYISGAFEIILGLMLLLDKTRFIAGWGLILLLIAVSPANIYLAQTNGAALNTSPAIPWGRLPFQAIFILIAYWHTKTLGT